VCTLRECLQAKETTFATCVTTRVVRGFQAPLMGEEGVARVGRWAWMLGMNLCGVCGLLLALAHNSYLRPL
jgi:hypothetical protein